MWILQVLWIVLSVLCSLLLSFCICQVQQFCRTISYGVPSCLLPCILFIVHTSLQGMFVVCHINQIAILVMVSHFWNRYCRFPFRLSNSFPLCLVPRHYSLSYEVCKPYCHVGFPMSELCCFYMRRALRTIIGWLIPERGWALLGVRIIMTGWHCCISWIKAIRETDW